MKTDKMVKWGLIFLIFTVTIALTLIAWDWRIGVDDSVNDRIALLEKQMKDKIRPVIQINRGTVYNTDGEIVIERIKDRSQ